MMRTRAAALLARSLRFYLLLPGTMCPGLNYIYLVALSSGNIHPLPNWIESIELKGTPYFNSIRSPIIWNSLVAVHQPHPFDQAPDYYVCT